MNKFIYVITIVAASFFSTNAYSQFSETDLRTVTGLSVGLEKNNIGWVDYGFNSGFHINIMHTIAPRELNEQNWRFGISYNRGFKYLQIALSPFMNSNWNLSFANVGTSIKVSNFWKHNLFRLGVEYIPHYDTNIKFHNAWAFAVQAKLFKNISILCEYGEKPDYRIAYKRIYAGFEVKVLNLYLKPLLEIPIHDSGIKLKSSRVLVSAYYTFKCVNPKR